MNIQEQIFETINILTDSKIKELKFDKTIKGIITSDAKANIGEYEAKYQDLIFKVYSTNNTVKYKKDDNVFILVPDGDMNNKKNIVSSSKSEGEEFVDITTSLDKFGINFVDEADDFTIRLSTTADDEETFKVKEEELIRFYPTQKMILIGADIVSNIDTNSTGDYGVELVCNFTNSVGAQLTHTFKFSLVDMVGNPFNSRGYKYVKLPLLEDRMVSVASARAYSKGFRLGYEDIVISNLEIEYVKPIDQDGSEYSGSILAPKGTHFKNGVLHPTEKLDLIMEYKVRGEVLNSDAINYSWFIMDSSIQSTGDVGYNPDAGFGWKLIAPGDFPKELIDGVGSRQLSVFANFVPNFSTFKCVAYYKNNMVKATQTLVDHTEELSIEITSSNGITFKNGSGTTLLSCVVTQNDRPLQEVITYKWTKINEGGSILNVGNGSSIQVSASDIGNKSIYTCEVGLREGNRPILTGNITLVNIVDGEVVTTGMVVVGGFRVVLYDADGYAPNIVSDGMQFDLYKNGVKVLSNLDWTWSIPDETQSLLSIVGGGLTSKNKILHLDVAKRFSLTKSNNVVTLIVKHTEAGVENIFREDVPISITKVGQNGADGAAGKPGTDGNSYVYEIQGGTPTLIYDNTGNNPQPSTLQEFTLMFSENANLEVVKNVDKVTWSLESSATSLLSFRGETSKRSIVTLKGEGANPHRVTLVPDASWNSAKFNNYLSAVIEYKGQIFREYYPIAVTKNGSTGTPGAPGAPGTNGINGPAGKPGEPGKDGKVYYTWIKYADNISGGGMSNLPDNKKFIGMAYNKETATESNTASDYTWSKYVGDQGLPGAPGEDGVTLYTWIKYADNANGGGMSDTATNKTYIGLAFNKSAQQESTNASDYQWSKLKGDQGIPGQPGADGAPRYTWVKYADTPTTGMSDNPSGKNYLGLAHNKTTSTESTTYSDYTWSKVKGDDGRPGVPGNSPYSVSLLSTNGLTFKVGDVDTVIYAIVMNGYDVVTNQIPNSGFEWIRIDQHGDIDTIWRPIYVNGQYDKIKITPNDIIEKATFECSILI